MYLMLLPCRSRDALHKALLRAATVVWGEVDPAGRGCIIVACSTCRFLIILQGI